MSQGIDPSPEDLHAVVVDMAWEQLFESDGNLLFSSRGTTVDLSSIHPEAVHIFSLWQIYLDNIHPLLKVTHTPSLQPRIIEAAGNITNINPVFEALMFGIYSVSILSLAEGDCLAMFASSKDLLLTRYQFGCQQALLNCGFLRGADRDCLTALYLYLVSTSRIIKNPVFILMTLGFGTAKHHSNISVIYAWRCDSHCAAHGYSQRVSFSQMHCFRGGNAPKTLVVARTLRRAYQ
jgi:hypothetical protein